MKRDVDKAISKIVDQWMAIDGVEGIGPGKDGDSDCIILLISARTDEIRNSIPSVLDGFAVKIIESGQINAQHY